MSIGARVVVLNAILTNLPIFQFTFFKAPKVVVIDIVRLQRDFFCGGGGDLKKKTN